MWTEYLGGENGADGVKKNVVSSLLANLKEADCSADLVVDGEYIRIGLKARGWQGLDWIYLAQDRDASGFVQCWEFLDYLSST
jgi:hypothetical protein